MGWGQRLGSLQEGERGLAGLRRPGLSLLDSGAGQERPVRSAGLTGCWRGASTLAPSLCSTLHHKWARCARLLGRIPVSASESSQCHLRTIPVPSQGIPRPAPASVAGSSPPVSRVRSHQLEGLFLSRGGFSKSAKWNVRRCGAVVS